MIFLLSEVQEKLGYKFKDIDLLRQCFTHSSYANEHKGEKHYERLEFLGDSVLGFVVADYLFKTKKEDEGLMTFDKQALVSTSPLCTATKKLGIENYILIGGSSLKITDKICENLFESVIAGIYLDGGFEEAKKFIYTNLINVIKIQKTKIDYKSKLNEYCAKNKLGEVKYNFIKNEGTEHLPKFIMAVLINNKEFAQGEGSSKKSAEQECAKKVFLSLTAKKSKNNKTKKKN